MDAASSEALDAAPAAATDAATTQDEAGAPQRADADVTDLLTAELDAAVAAAAPQRTDSTDVLTAELDALLAMPAPETAAPPAAKPPPPPQDAAAGDAEPLAGRGQWVAFSVANAYAAKQQGAMAAFARKAPEARDVRATLDTDEPWASEAHPRVALGAEGSLDASFKTCAYVRSDGGGDERLRLQVRAKAPGGDDASIGAAEFSRDDLVRARDPVVAPLAPGAGAFCRATPLGPDAVLDAAARRAGTNTMRQAFLLDDGRVLSEACCEGVGAHEVVRDVLKPFADGATRAAAAWLARAERERVLRCAFADDADARAHGARKLRVAVLGARGVTRATAAAADGAPPADVKANLARLGRSAFGFARRLRSGDLPNPLGAEDAAAPAPFVRVAVERDGARTRLGRTNTEYASVAPSFGANARAERSCPHAAPRTAFEAEEGAARLVAGSDLSPLGVAPVLEAYAPAAGAGASLILTLLDERYSVERGVVGEAIGEACIDLPAPSSGPPAPAWVPVGGSGAEVFVAVHVAALEGAAAAALPDDGDEDDLRAWLDAAAPPAPAAARDHGWMRRHGEALAATGARLRRLAAEAEAQARAGRSCFKSSTRKGDAGVAAHGTNVHAYLASVRGVEGGAALLAMCTAGAPAAAATLGSDAGGLLRLQRGASGGDETAAAYATRRALVLAQALQVLAQALRAKVAALAAAGPSAAKGVCESWREKGTDVVFLSLISTAGRELAMLEDVAGIVEALQDVNVDICAPSGYDPSTRTLGLGMTGVDGLGLEAFRASVVLVAQGLDVRQSLAHSQQTAKDAVSSFLATAKTAAQDVRQQLGGGTSPAPGAPPPPSDDDARRLQNTLNRAAAQRLAARAEKLGDGGAARHFGAAVERESAALASGAFEKHWTIIVEAERLARRLDLPLAVFCKSGKDRTGMAATLAAAAFCGEFGRDNEPAVLATANLLRAHGTRILICEKNTGRRRYAFNAFQREFLPAPFRPPPSTIEDLASSLIHRDMS